MRSEANMSSRDFQGLLSARPFVPLRVYAQDGRTYDLMHPEQAFVMNTYVVIPLSEEDQVPERLEDRYRLEFLSTMHIVRVEQLRAISANGSKTTSDD
jgi:hypothetical protein